MKHNVAHPRGRVSRWLLGALGCLAPLSCGGRADGPRQEGGLDTSSTVGASATSASSGGATVSATSTGGSGGAAGAVSTADTGDASTSSGTPETPPEDPPASTACAADTYDHDDDPSTACRAWTPCEAGQYVQDEGSPTSDRSCVGCPSGTYSEVSNARACSPWTPCAWVEVETEAPSATSDRSCGPGSAYRWFETVPTSVAVDREGNVLVGSSDGSVRKYDPSGNELWTEQVNSEDACVAVDSQNNVLVTAGAGDLLFLSKRDPDGQELWSERVRDDRSLPLRAGFVTVDSQDNALVAGTQNNNPFVSKHDRDGQKLWLDNFDSGPVAFARAVAVDDEGNVVVAGDTNGKLPGIGDDVPGYLFVRKYDPDGGRLWLDQFGNESGFEEAHAVAVDGEGNVLAAGFTNWDGHSDGADAIVRKYDADGNELWTDVFEASHEVRRGARALAVDSEDNVLVAGNSASLGGSTGAGVFVRKYDVDGNELWTQLDATDADPNAIHEAIAMTVDAAGRVFVAGFSDYDGTSGGSGFVWRVPEP